MLETVQESYMNLITQNTGNFYLIKRHLTNDSETLSSSACRYEVIGFIEVTKILIGELLAVEPKSKSWACSDYCREYAYERITQLSISNE
jgi:hypothetical protein